MDLAGGSASWRDTGKRQNRMPKSPSKAQQMIGDIAPKLVELTDDVLFGDVWERPGLSKRDRSLVTVAALVALYRTNELPPHLDRALENGVTREELVEAITQLALCGLAIRDVRHAGGQTGVRSASGDRSITS